MNPAIPAFLLTFISFIFLLLASISSPLLHSLTFLHANAAGGSTEPVSFGMWGWCIDNGGACTPTGLGYYWNPAIVHWLTYALILIPIACGFTFLALVSLIPILCTRGLRMYPSPAFSLLALLASLSSLVAFVFMIGLFATAYSRFHELGATPSWGALPWLVLVAAVFTTIASIHSGCGTMFRGRRSPYVTYAPSGGRYAY